MPMRALDGVTMLPSYRTCVSILYAMPLYTAAMQGPLQVDHRQAAFIQANLAQVNIRQAVEAADLRFINNALAAAVTISRVRSRT
jgi:hypothetical protein